MRPERVSGSYRDRKGQVFTLGDRVLRSVVGSAVDVQRELVTSDLFKRLVSSGRVIGTKIAPDDPAFLEQAGPVLLLEHERVPFISYPYEWPFAALQAAALLQLDLHMELLEHGYTLSDASAYNIQFRGPEPVFIDTLSIERYVEGTYWSGHRQFCDQFLNPLIFSARLGVPYNAAYRGRLEGLPSTELVSMLRLRHKLSPQVFLNVVLPARLEASARRGKLDAAAATRGRPLPRRALQRLLGGLRRWIAGLRSPAGQTDWTSYAGDNTYGDEERVGKRKLIASAVHAARPGTVLDLGCNTGDYAAVALQAGAGTVIGAEADPFTADLAFRRAAREKLAFLPVVQDGANPSPSQGWLEAERPSFRERVGADFLLALAVEHHLAIGRNLPLDQLVPWMVGLAPRGVIEFVQKKDPTVKVMLALREDIFPDYTEDNFRRLLETHARVVSCDTTSGEDRRLFQYERPE